MQARQTNKNFIALGVAAERQAVKVRVAVNDVDIDGATWRMEQVAVHGVFDFIQLLHDGRMARRVHAGQLAQAD